MSGSAFSIILLRASETSHDRVTQDAQSIEAWNRLIPATRTKKIKSPPQLYRAPVTTHTNHRLTHRRAHTHTVVCLYRWWIDLRSAWSSSSCLVLPRCWCYWCCYVRRLACFWLLVKAVRRQTPPSTPPPPPPPPPVVPWQRMSVTSIILSSAIDQIEFRIFAVRSGLIGRTGMGVAPPFNTHYGWMLLLFGRLYIENSRQTALYEMEGGAS